MLFPTAPCGCCILVLRRFPSPGTSSPLSSSLPSTTPAALGMRPNGTRGAHTSDARCNVAGGKCTEDKMRASGLQKSTADATAQLAYRDAPKDVESTPIHCVKWSHFLGVTANHSKGGSGSLLWSALGHSLEVIFGQKP
ncbi:hypothetical protein FB45DRAFT_874891 [Roridomyces roridus]|uniref:Uncharacterized protein n=1 Tax=Roridomyces roridus TaxID=1738132 RepID=A0AAD7B7T8_9AGAR|nr:hypothetical protein FB45DRAFT_874891 [Roridomyces roridus]